MKRPGDPYEFEEEGGGSNCNMDGFKRGQAIVKEESKDKNSKTDNLFTSEGLQPSYKDLDQIFDNSDYTSSDEAVRLIENNYFCIIKFFLTDSNPNSSRLHSY